jgi:hypothetical protein
VYDIPMRLLAVSLIVLLPLCAQDDQKKGKGGGGQATNIKVLKTTNRQEIVPLMRTFNAGLGVECTFCHVPNNFPSDDNPKKATARQMIQMVDGLNAGFNAAMSDTKAHITCYTCHRGDQHPKTEADPKPPAQ